MRVKEYKENKKRHRIYALIVIILGIAIFLLSFFLLFYVQRIEVKGVTYSNAQEIERFVKNDELSKNSLYLLWKYTWGKGDIPPYLEEVKLKLRAPWSVQVHVSEKPVVGGVIADDQYVYFDKDGLVVLKGETMLEGVPLIEGMVIKNATLYKTLAAEEKEIFEGFLTVSGLVQKYNMTVERIVCSETEFHLYIGTIVVKLGDGNYEQKVAQIPPILEKLAGETGTLHLEHYGEGSESISFMKGEAPPQEAEPVEENVEEPAEIEPE